MNNKNEAIAKLKKKWGREASILKSLEKNQFEYIESSKDSHCVLMKNKNILEDIILFGYINFPNDFIVSKKLFEKIIETAKSFKGKKLIGPVNYSTWFGYRWMIDGFTEIKIYKEPSNPKYFPETAKKLGFKKYKKYISTLVKSNDSKYTKSKEKYKAILNKDYTFKRYVGLKICFALKNIHTISIDSFVDNPLYSPISFGNFKKIYVSAFNKDINLKPIVDMCFYKKEPVGFLFTYKNPYSTNIYVWKTIAIKKSFQNKGIGSALRYIAHNTALENKCKYVLHHLTYENNIVKKLRNKDDKIFKKYALFYKDL